MTRIAALLCDWDDCGWTSEEAKAKSSGWLCVGGERRGRSRTDLCPQHARQVIAQVTVALSRTKKAKKRAK